MNRLEGIKGLLAGLNTKAPLLGRMPRQEIVGLPEGEGFSFRGIFYWFAIAAFFITLILILIHYTIRPIFSFAPGDGGLFSLAAQSGKEEDWKKVAPDSTTPFEPTNNLPCGFTLSLDVFVAKPNTFAPYQRVFLYRGSSPRTPDSNNLATNYPESNLYMYLEPDTNDLVITARTQDSSSSFFYESAPTLYNVPIGIPFRIVLVFLPQMMEVYMNGRLHATKILTAPPVNIAGKFFATPQPFESIVKPMNIQYWARPLTAKEIAANNTGLTSAKSFNMPTETPAVCSA